MSSTADIILTILSILAILVTTTKWWIDTKVEKEVSSKIAPFAQNVEDIAHEVKTNGGESIKDQITRTESGLKDLKTDVNTLKIQNDDNKRDHDIMSSKLDEMYKIMLEYISRRP
jgi:preprotein translocase subunit SecF